MYFNVGRSGYLEGRAGSTRATTEYARAVLVLASGFGSANASTVACCHTTRYALLPILLCRLFGVGRVVYFNHGVPYVGHRGLPAILLRLLERLNVAAAHVSITVSPAMVPLLDPRGRRRDVIRSTFPGSSSGLRDSWFVSAEYARRRASEAQSVDGVRFLYAGRLQARKGVFVLLEAWKRHVAARPDDRLVICGFTKDALAAAGSDTLLPGLEFRGYVEQMQPVYDGVHVVVSPSFHEGFGYTLLEGAARGCAVASADIPGPDVMFSHRMCGQMFEPGSADSLAAVLLKLSCERRYLGASMLLSFRAAQRFRTDRVTIPDLLQPSHSEPGSLLP